VHFIAVTNAGLPARPDGSESTVPVEGTGHHLSGNLAFY